MENEPSQCFVRLRVWFSLISIIKLRKIKINECSASLDIKILLKQCKTLFISMFICTVHEQLFFFFVICHYNFQSLQFDYKILFPHFMVVEKRERDVEKGDERKKNLG